MAVPVYFSDLKTTFKRNLYDKLGTLLEKLNLQAYQPKNPEMDTFPLLRMRMDWILISSELEFVTYKVLSDVISDHYPVVCEIAKTG